MRDIMMAVKDFFVAHGIDHGYFFFVCGLAILAIEFRVAHSWRSLRTDDKAFNVLALLGGVVLLVAGAVRLLGLLLGDH